MTKFLNQDNLAEGITQFDQLKLQEITFWPENSSGSHFAPFCLSNFPLYMQYMLRHQFYGASFLIVHKNPLAQVTQFDVSSTAEFFGRPICSL